ncbi:MAG: VWA domain-containing protein [Acidobacteria bacterium]|nr:VWA domain-containing protein [Acidobacteriota bacterium]
MTFEAPQYLVALFLVAVPALASFVSWRHIRRGRPELDLDRLRRVSRLGTSRRQILLVSLSVLGSASLLLALAEPRIEVEGRREIFKTLDIVFLLDTSLSMRARDVLPSRIERASEEIKNFFVRQKDEAIGRVGLVSFAGSSIILSYFTRDGSNILFYLDSLQTDILPGYGTDIAGGIANALALVEKERATDRDLVPSDVVFVLISDGEDNGKEMTRLVARAAQAGYRIYCIGIGSQGGALIPLPATDGRQTFLLDERRRPVLATFDEGTLRWVAVATGGTYHRSFTGTELRANLEEILLSARRLVRVERVVETRPVERWFLAAGVVLLGVLMIVLERVRDGATRS